jgi:hypothetical protein
MFNNITFNLTLYPSTSHLYHVRWLESSKSAQAGNLLAPEEINVPGVFFYGSGWRV